MLNTLFLLNIENCMLIAILDNGTSIILLNNHKVCSLLWSTWLYQKNDVHSFQYSLERMSYISLLKILYNNALLKCNTFREMWIAHKLNSVLPNSGCHRYACWMYTRIHFFYWQLRQLTWISQASCFDAFLLSMFVQVILYHINTK